MIEITGDIWEFHKSGWPIAITTNGELNTKGAAIMGKGIALDAKIRFPGFPAKLGDHIKRHGNNLGYFSPYRIFSFPTKNDWRQNSDIVLIERSSMQLAYAANWLGFDRVYLVRPGCNNGKLSWDVVKPVIAKYLDDKYIIVQN
jgi:hypothetical protein